jgi:hypothetical protein
MSVVESELPRLKMSVSGGISRLVLAGRVSEADLIVGRVGKLETSHFGGRLGRVHITSNGGADRLVAISAVVEDTNSMRLQGTRDICNEPTIA